jgi:hypothetical protein
MKLKKNEDQSVDNLPMEGVTETKFGAETKGWTFFTHFQIMSNLVKITNVIFKELEFSSWKYSFSS